MEYLIGLIIFGSVIAMVTLLLRIAKALEHTNELLARMADDRYHPAKGQLDRINDILGGLLEHKRGY